MKCFIFSAAVMLLACSAFASETYQSGALVGNWETVDDGANPDELALQVSYDSKTQDITVMYCNDWNLAMANTCIRTTNWTETGPYIAANDAFLATFQSLPHYTFRVDPNDADALTKSWAGNTIEYYRIK